MRFSLFSFILVLSASCGQKENDAASAVYPIGDASEWLNGDENFGVRHWNGQKSKDSLSTLFTLFNDLNNDGIIDTAKAINYRLRHQTIIHFTCFKPLVLKHDIEELQISDAGDLNSDGQHEIIVLQEGSESCWDNLKLYSLIANEWVEKYSGMTYQCIEKPMYRFTKLNDKTIQIFTFGESKDSIDSKSGDTLEQVLPNQQRVHTINW